MRTSPRLMAAALAVALVASTAPASAQEAPTVTSHVVESFDGTPIVSTLFLPSGASDDAPVPLVLRTHGWGGTGETEVGTGTLARLLDEGYAVLTWDQRGFGCSGGTVRIDDPQFEGRDVSALIDWAVANAPVASIDGDPIVGMTGGSYAGGIQTATASIDSRLDALAPEISWADLRYSLYSGEVVNQGWVAALYAAGKATATLLGQSPDCPAGPQDGGLDPAIDQGVTEFITSGTVGPDTLDFFAKSSLASYGETDPVTVPTLVMQGSVDTLFDLTDGYRIYEHVRDQGAPARFVAFCGGHVACPDTYADAGDRAHLDDAIVAWFARHLKGEDVATGAPIEYRTNDGEWRSAPSMPLPGATAVPLEGQAEGLVVVPVLDIPDVEGLAGLIAVPEGIPGLPITTSVPTAEGDPRGATFPVAVAEDGPLEILAIPDVTVTVSGTTVPLDQASPTAHIFVKFVHREAGEVLNLQEGAIAVDLSDGEVTVDVPMPGLAYTLPEGDHLDVQVATNSLMHASGRVPAVLDVTLAGSLPIVGTAGRPSPDEGDAVAGPADGSGDEVEPQPVSHDRPLPVTGANGSVLLGLLALSTAALLRRRPKFA